MKKTKLTQTKKNELKRDYHQHNKRMAQTNNRRLQFSTFDDYIAWRYGSTKLRSVRRSPSAGDITCNKRYERETAAKSLPSLMEQGLHRSTKESTAKKSVPQYSGEEITGIAVSHKSNLLPVGRGTDPKIFATMRRGDGEIS